MLKYENIFAKVFVIEKVKNIGPWAYGISDLIDEGIVGTFRKKELQKNKSKRIWSRKRN